MDWVTVFIYWFWAGLGAFLTYIYLTLKIHRYGYSWKKLTKG